MASGGTTSTLIASIIPKIYATARQTQIEEARFRQLSTGVNIASKPGNTVEYPKWNNFPAEELTEDVDMTNTQHLDTANVTLGVNERGAQTIVTDNAAEDANEDVMKRHGVILGEALSTKDDLDGIAACGDASTGFTPVVGSASSALDLSLWTASLTRARVNFIKGSLNAVVHSYAYHALASSLIANSSYGTLRPAADEMGMKFRVNEFMGVRIYEDNNIALAGATSTTNAVGFVFPKESLIRVEKRGLRIEKERNASYRHWELNATTRYAYGVVDRTLGIKLLSLAVPV